MMQPSPICSAGASVLALHLGFGTALAADNIVAGRPTDTRGAAVAGQPGPCIVDLGDGTCLSQDDDGRGPARLQSDAQGAFSTILPPGRFVVAAVKRGDEISMTQVRSSVSGISSRLSGGVGLTF